MNKLKTIIDLVNQGDKAKLWKYLNKGIYSKKDKVDVMKNSIQSGGVGDNDIEYLYVISTVVDLQNPLMLVCSECKGINYSDNFALYDDTNSTLDRMVNGGFLASAYKINPNQKIYDSNTGSYIKISNFINNEFDKDEIIYITKEQYEKTSGIPIHGVFASNYIEFSNEDKTKVVTDLYTILNHLRDNNLDINDFYYFYLHCINLSNIFDYCRITNYVYYPANDVNSESYSITITGSKGGDWPIIVTPEEIYAIG